MTAHQSVASTADIERGMTLGPLLHGWFLNHGRDFPWRRWKDRYRLVVTEVLLQRTRADVVARFVPGFFEAYPDWTRLAGAGLDELTACLRPLGLNSRRATTLRRLALEVKDGREIDEGLPGVGQYIARATAVILDSKPLAMVDANMVRVLQRIFDSPWMADYRSDARLQALAQSVIAGGADPRQVNWAVLDLGAMICLPRRPICPACPLVTRCGYADQNS